MNLEFLIEENKRLEKEVKRLIYENGFLQGRLIILYQQLPRVGMVINKGGKYDELQQEGGAQ